MIVFDLECTALGHRFEGWFGSSSDFDEQQRRGLVCCPQCGSSDVRKAPMAPAVPRKGNQMRQSMAGTGTAGAVATGPAVPAEAAEVFARLADLQAKVLANSRWVGDSFAEVSRAMHYGEREHEAIHGQATLEQARDLLDEGVPLMPLPLPVAAPEEIN